MRWSLAVNRMFRCSERELKTGGRLAAQYPRSTEDAFNIMVSWPVRSSKPMDMAYGLIA